MQTEKEHQRELRRLGLDVAESHSETDSSDTNDVSLESTGGLKRVRRQRRTAKVGSSCSLENYADAKKCSAQICSDDATSKSVTEMRALALRLNVPGASCLRKQDLCAAIDLQTVAYFTSRDFERGTEQINDVLQALSDAASKVATKDRVAYSQSLLDVTRFLNNQYRAMFALLAPTSNLSMEKRNQKLIDTSNETLKQMTNIARGVYGRFVDPSVLKGGSAFPPRPSTTVNAPQPRSMISRLTRK